MKGKGERVRKQGTHGIKHARSPRLSIYPNRIAVEILRDFLVERFERMVIR